MYDHDCVIVTDLGGFIAHYKPASINSALHVINPPSKKLAFNSSLKNNDGLLANHIANRQALSYMDANEVIREYVKDALMSMKDGQKLKIDKVGVLFIDGEKNLQFQPDQNVNYLTSSFGLAPLHSPQIKRDQPAPSEETVISTKPVKPFVKKSTSPKKKVSWKIIEVIPAAAVLTFLFIIPPVLNEFNNNLSTLLPFSRMNEYINEWKGDESYYKPARVEYKSPFEVPPAKVSEPNLPKTDIPSTQPVEEIAPVNNAVAGTGEEVKTNTEVASPDAENIDKPVSVTVDDHKYFVIGGCFRMKENADKFIAEMKAKGNDAVIIGQNNAGLYMVSLFNSDNYTQITDALPEIKSNTVESAWIYKK